MKRFKLKTIDVVSLKSLEKICGFNISFDSYNFEVNLKFYIQEKLNKEIEIQMMKLIT